VDVRVSEHPILGGPKTGRVVEITVNGQKVQAIEGESIAAAMLAWGLRVSRYTIRRNQPRGIYCGIGQCTDCVMVVNGVPNVRTCVTPVSEGMVVETQYGDGRGPLDEQV
jgi:predicted molibdopterin-dependent oxidoreductase YjgC